MDDNIPPEWRRLVDLYLNGAREADDEMAFASFIEDRAKTLPQFQAARRHRRNALVWRETSERAWRSLMKLMQADPAWSAAEAKASAGPAEEASDGE